MENAMNAVLEFHETMGQTIGDPVAPDVNRETQFRWDLIEEEFKELTLALEGKSKSGPLTERERIVAVADALGDMVYVIAGAAVTWGIDLASVFNEIHRSNMTKTRENKRKDGKVSKGPNYVPPNIEAVLTQAKESLEAHGYGEDSWWPNPTVLAGPAPQVPSQSGQARKAMKDIQADFVDENYPLAEARTWIEPKENASFGTHAMPAEMSQKLLVRATDTIMGQPMQEPEERDTEPTILYNGRFLNRGAFIFDCPCGRTHEVSTQLGSRGGLAKTGQATCYCGKVYKITFDRPGSDEYAEFEVEDLGGHS